MKERFNLSEGVSELQKVRVLRDDKRINKLIHKLTLKYHI